MTGAGTNARNSKPERFDVGVGLNLASPEHWWRTIEGHPQAKFKVSEGQHSAGKMVRYSPSR